LSARSTFIPNYLKARSPQGLRRLMFQKNLKDGKQYNYFSVEFVNAPKDPHWVAWFYEDITDNFTGKIKEILGEVENGGG